MLTDPCFKNANLWKTYFKSYPMNLRQQVILSPYQVELNSILTVRSVQKPFDQIQYIITDESGRLIRKGAISQGTIEFKLCIVGFKTGTYCISIGHSSEKFSVMWVEMKRTNSPELFTPD